MARKHKLLRWLLVFFLLVVLPVALVVTDQAVRRAAERHLTLHVQWGSGRQQHQFEERMKAHRLSRWEPEGPGDTLETLEEPSPFLEIQAFDENALSWGRDLAAGILVFDANGDGRLDVYVPQARSIPVRPTDGEGVLLPRPRTPPNTLYLNRGNRDGQPFFEASTQAVLANDTYVEAELLIEDFPFPRTSAGDGFERQTRGGIMAVAADLDADGRTDLIVANGLPGLPMSSPRTQHLVPPFVNPTGRQEHLIGPLLSLPSAGFLRGYTGRNDEDILIPTARGLEPIASNSVYLNRGDADGDGLPEWIDATRSTGLGGHRHTNGLVVADFDLDGDLDVFEANSADPDLWPGGARALAGGANQLYINQLAETGRLTFSEESKKWDVQGVFDTSRRPPRYPRVRELPVLPTAYSLALNWWVHEEPEFLSLGGPPSEPAEFSWAAIAQDVNGDGYPDLWVANDFTYLRLHINEQGRRFRDSRSHWVHDITGNWMGFSAADFDGDGHEDLFAANLGGASLNNSFSRPGARDLLWPSLSVATFLSQHWFGGHTVMHALIDGADPSRPLVHRIRHSRIMPPDLSLPGNVRKHSPRVFPSRQYSPDTLDAYELAWGSAAFDVQNDGRPDLYFVGGLFSRGGGILPVTSTNPGRLLINASPRPGFTRFVDLTAEYHLFNIHELDYGTVATEGFVSRPSPSKNWNRRSEVRSSDLSVWGVIGPTVNDLVASHDLVQASENGRSVLAADLDGDGFEDLLVRNLGGYDSRASRAADLKTRFAGRVASVPSVDPNLPAPTEFEPGSTRFFLNTHGRQPERNHWLKVSLLDDRPDALNRHAIGARITLDDKAVLWSRIGGPFGAAYLGPLTFGLGRGQARFIEVQWPTKERTTTRYALGGLQDRHVLLKRSGTWKVLDLRHAAPRKLDP